MFYGLTPMHLLFPSPDAHRAHPGGVAHRQGPGAKRPGAQGALPHPVPAPRHFRRPDRLGLRHPHPGLGHRAEPGGGDACRGEQLLCGQPKSQRPLRHLYRQGAGGLYPAHLPPLHQAGGDLHRRPVHGGLRLHRQRPAEPGDLRGGVRPCPPPSSWTP